MGRFSSDPLVDQCRASGIEEGNVASDHETSRDPPRQRPASSRCVSRRTTATPRALPCFEAERHGAGFLRRPARRANTDRMPGVYRHRILRARHASTPRNRRAILPEIEIRQSPARFELMIDTRGIEQPLLGVLPIAASFGVQPEPQSRRRRHRTQAPPPAPVPRVESTPAYSICNA